MQKKQLITIWDIDKTLYDGYAIIDFGKYLASIGYFSEEFTSEIDHATAEYKSNIISYEEFAQEVYRIYGKFLANKNQYEVLQYNKKFWQRATSNIFPAANSLLKVAVDYSADHAAISGSSFESLYYLMDSLKFSKLKSTEYLTLDGNYTGEHASTLVSHYDKSKLDQRVLNQRNKYEYVLGVGDNLADTAFLEHVDIPIIMGSRDPELIEWGSVHNAYQINDPQDGTAPVLAEIHQKLAELFSQKLK